MPRAATKSDDRRFFSRVNPTMVTEVVGKEGRTWGVVGAWPGTLHFASDRRAETHERFYSIEVHRHRFARHARKVPFEKCEHWRKVCGRSAKDQIASTL